MHDEVLIHNFKLYNYTRVCSFQQYCMFWRFFLYFADLYSHEKKEKSCHCYDTKHDRVTTTAAGKLILEDTARFFCRNVSFLQDVNDNSYQPES